MFESSFRLQRHALLFLLLKNFGVHVAGYYKKFRVFCRQYRFDSMNGKKDISRSRSRSLFLSAFCLLTYSSRSHTLTYEHSGFSTILFQTEGKCINGANSQCFPPPKTRWPRRGARERARDGPPTRLSFLSLARRGLITYMEEVPSSAARWKYARETPCARRGCRSASAV